MGEYGYELNPDGCQYLSRLVSEVIGNAEEHSGMTYWWVSAYMRGAGDSASGRTYGDCHIAIFCFGKTLAESLQELPPDALLRNRVETLVKLHQGRGFFTPRWTSENLWTLYALQEGVSRYNCGVDRIGDRGVGTADMIEFFQNLGGSSIAGYRPEMCVLSGRTHVLFDGRYRIREQPVVRGESRRIIAFNGQNSLELPPDSSVVRSLGRRFPGTMISLRFYLDPVYLRGDVRG